MFQIWMESFANIDLWQRILLGFSKEDLVRLTRVSKFLHSLLYYDSFWAVHVDPFKPVGMTSLQYFRSCHQKWTVARALKENRVDQLKRLNQKPVRGDLVDVPLTNKAALEWLVTSQAFPVKTAIHNGDLELCKILAAGDAYFNDWHASYASVCNKYEILEWLASRKIIPRPGALAVACTYGDLKMLKYLYSLGVRYQRWRSGLNGPILTPAAAARGHVEILDWLYSQGCHPTEDALRAAKRRGQQQVINWANNKNITKWSFRQCWY